MIFATDLDRTIIYSSKFVNKEIIDKVTLIEEVDGKPISYISNYALKELENINKYINVIPVTTRSINQFKRINTFKYCKYAITTNGGTILYNGEILKEWDEYIKKILGKYKEKEAEIIELLKKHDFIIKEPNLIDDKFIFTKTNNVELCEKILEKKIDKDIWNFTIQSQKVYVIPKEITKSSAVEFLKNKLKEKIVIASGDGKLDKDMLEIAQIAILPKHGELYEKHKYYKDNCIIVDNGIFSADDIINNVKKQIKEE